MDPSEVSSWVIPLFCCSSADCLLGCVTRDGSCIGKGVEIPTLCLGSTDWFLLMIGVVTRKISAILFIGQTARTSLPRFT